LGTLILRGRKIACVCNGFRSFCLGVYLDTDVFKGTGNGATIKPYLVSGGSGRIKQPSNHRQRSRAAGNAIHAPAFKRNQQADAEPMQRVFARIVVIFDGFGMIRPSHRHALAIVGKSERIAG